MDEKEGEGEVGEVTVTSSRVYEVRSETEPYVPPEKALSYFYTQQSIPQI